ncbi:MAG: glycosyltransferase family 4 protein [Blastocatellia bacterium]|nr:glycosyltransferase family 4 protein [Blastocatellia bacterium]
MSKVVIANSKMVADVLIKQENVSPDKVNVMYYGYQLDEFTPKTERVNQLKLKYNLTEKHPIIGVISRFTHWKGVQDIIPAFAKFLVKYPNAKLVLANAKGNYATEIHELLNKVLTPDSYVLIEFEEEIFALYKTFDQFIHTPVNKDVEAFGQIYIESLLMEIPSIFTLSGIASEIAVDRKNSLVVPHCDSEAIYDAMITLIEEPDLRERLKKQGRKDILSNFQALRLAQELDALYSKL